MNTLLSPEAKGKKPELLGMITLHTAVIISDDEPTESTHTKH